MAPAIAPQPLASRQPGAAPPWQSPPLERGTIRFLLPAVTHVLPPSRPSSPSRGGRRPRACLRSALALFLACGLLAQDAAGHPQPPQEKPSRIGALLDKAKSLLRTPYRRGGSGPSGFDCSGFVRHVFGTFGVLLSRCSHSQAREGMPVDLEQIRPGDLLFFRSAPKSSRISHVGIYLGNGEFIHASAWGPKGTRGIRIAKLFDAYHGSRLTAARRVLSEEEARAVQASAAQAK